MVFETVRPSASAKQERKGAGRSPAPGVTRAAGGEAEAGRGVPGQREAGGVQTEMRERGASPPPCRGLHEGLGAEGQSWPAGPGDRPPRGPVPSGVLLKTRYKRAGTGHQGELSTQEQGAGCSLSPRRTETAFRVPGVGLHPGDTETPGPCPLTPENLCHRVPTGMKRKLGRGRSSGTALDSPEPDLQAAAPCPELGPWAGLPAGLETDCACPSAGGGALA